MQTEKIKKIVIITTIFFFLSTLLFRLIPFLFPLTIEDLQPEKFHSVKFYDRHHQLLQEVLSTSSNRAVYVKISDISPYFLQAIIAGEDKNFYSHDGVDYTAVIRAFYQNTTSGEIVSGASTITLQLARLLDPAERTYMNKLREVFRAYRLEAGLNKQQILEAYVNRLPMGGNLYGIEGAARGYFRISAGDLTLAQATFLAAIPNSPNRLNPYHRPAEIKKRQRLILQRMAAEEMIDPERIDRVIKEYVSLSPQQSSFLAPHLVFHLLDTLPDDAAIVRTTIDRKLQKMVSEQIAMVLQRLQNYHVSNAAAILLDNESGEVLAYVGSADFFNPEIDGQVDGVQSLRQPGSTLKPFLYLLAQDMGFHPASLISDIPTHYRMPTGTYSPGNYSETFHGPVRLREALANSLNIPAVRVLAKIGVDTFLTRLKEYEFSSLQQDAEFYGIGLALGGGEVTLYELARAYRSLALGGTFSPVTAILEMNGEAFTMEQEYKIFSTPARHYLISDILTDHYARTTEFGFNSILNFPFDCAVKTGTSFKFCDNWTIGYTSDYTLGVWVGNFDHTPMMKVSGVSGAGPIFANIMLQLYKERPRPVPFAIPPGLNRVSICPLSGKKPVDACPTRIEEWLTDRDMPRYHEEVCDMHFIQDRHVQTVVPAKFRSWAEPLGYTIESTMNVRIDSLSIIAPKNGAVFYRFPNLAPEYQSIRLAADCPDSYPKIYWVLNGEQLAVTEKNHEFLWQIREGIYHLEIRADENGEAVSEIQFTVK
jgi:penicillin-binding protein 1C